MAQEDQNNEQSGQEKKQSPEEMLRALQGFFIKEAIMTKEKKDA